MLGGFVLPFKPRVRVVQLERIACLRRPPVRLTVGTNRAPLLIEENRRTVVTAAAASSLGPQTSFGYEESDSASMPGSDLGPDWPPPPLSNFPLRQQMLDCTTAPCLQILLQQHGPELTPPDIAAAWHVVIQQRLLILARSGDAAEASLNAHLLHLTQHHAAEMDPTALSTTAWALTSSGSGTSALMESILEHAQQQIIAFRPTEMSTMLWAAASHPHLAEHRRHLPFASLAALIDQGMKLELFSPRDLSTLLWSMGRTNYAHTVILEAAEAECRVKMPCFTSSDIARAMHGFAMLRHNPATLRSSMDERFGSKEKMKEFSPDEITLLLVAFGKLGAEPEDGVMRAAVNRVVSLVPPENPEVKFKKQKKIASAKLSQEDLSKFLHPRHMAHLMWTLARLEYRPQELSFISKMMRHLELNPGLYCAEDINALLWACSQLSLPINQGPIIAATQRAAVLAPKEPPSMVCSLLRYIATLSTKLGGEVPLAARKFAALAAVLVTPDAANLTPEDLGSVIIALGTLELIHVPRPMAQQLQRAAVIAASSSSFTSEELSQLSWAVVRLRWRDPVLLDALALAAAPRCALMLPEALAQMAWAFAAMDRPHPPLANALKIHCLAKLEAFSARDRARLAWAFGHLAHRHPIITQSFISRIVRSITRSELAQLALVGVAAVVWTCGRLDRHPGPVLEAAAERMTQSRLQYSKEQMAHVKVVLMKHGGGGGVNKGVHPQKASTAATTAL